MPETVDDVYERLQKVSELADGLEPEEFLSLLRKRIDKIAEEHEEEKENVLKYEKKIAQCDTYEEMKRLKSKKFWCEQRQSEAERKLYVIDRLLVEMGWSLGEGCM